MSNRAKLIEELRQIEGSYTHSIPPEKQKRAREIIKIIQECKCRECGKLYQYGKSRADYTGYCKQKCMVRKARWLGYRPNKGRSLYAILKDAGHIGNDFVCK